MTIDPILKVLVALITGGMMFSANANSLSLDRGTYAYQEQVAVTINYDFTDLPMFGGGINLTYDPNVLQFVSYTHEVFSGAPGSPQPTASPIGVLQSPGNYLGAGIGTFDFFVGITNAGTIGTFVFTVLGSGGDGGCGATLCLTPVGINPMVSIGGSDVTNELFPGGSLGQNVLLTDTDGDGDPDVTDPDDDNDGIGDELDTRPLVASNNCTTNDGTNATLVSAQVIDDVTCASKESVDVNGDNGALDTVVFGPNGDLRLISEKVIFKHTKVEVGGRMEVINADPCPSCPTYYAIGDTGPSGGIVFYVTDGGLHGLEAAPVDQTTASPGVEWGCEGTTVGADGTVVGTGAQNTADILNGCATRPITASVAADYMGPNGSTSGWFLPSTDELTLVFQNKDIIPNLLGGNYSSSTEFSGNPSSQALYLVMVDGSISPDFKLLSKNVRAIQAF